MPVLKIRRYECKNCGIEINSKFLFDGLVFDAEYFKEKMAESRQRKKEQSERVRKMLAESRSDALSLQAVDFSTVPGLMDALNAFTENPHEAYEFQFHNKFSLRRYESHIEAHIQDFPVSLTDIPPLSEDARLDRIWRFIALVFMAHVGLIEIQQEGQTIMVMHRETD